MKKRIRIISLVLSCIIIIGFVSLSYGADFENVTGAAFAFSPNSGIKTGTSDIKAAAANPVGSSTDPFYVNPKSDTATRYYVNSSGNVATSSVTVSSFADIVSYITYSIAYTENYIGSRLVNYLSQITTDVDDIRNYLNNNYWVLLNSIDSKLSSLGAGAFVPYFMPDPSTYDYTANEWKNIYVYTANNTGVSSYSYSSDSVIRQLREIFLNDNALLYQVFRRSFNYVLTDDYTNADYQKYFNIDTGSEYSAYKRSVWVDIRYINRFLSALVARTTGIISDTTFTLYDYNNTANTITPNSLYDYIRISNEKITQSLGRLAYVLANDQDIAIRQNTNTTVQNFNSNFMNSSKSFGLKPQRLDQIAYSTSSINNAFTSSTSYQNAFTGFSAGTDGRWDWFSTDILNSLDTTQNHRKANNLTNFLDSYYIDVELNVNGEIIEDVD